MESLKPKILVVDDEPSVLLTVGAILEQEGYDVDTVSGGAQAVSDIRSRHYDLVLTDLKMPGVDGMAVLEAVGKHSPGTVTVMMTGYGSLDSALEALQRGAYEYLLKPAEVADLKLAVKRSLERKRFSEIDALYSVSRAVTSTDVAEIGEEVAEAVKRVLGLANARLITYAHGAPEGNCPADLARALSEPKVRATLISGGAVLREDAPPLLKRWADAAGCQSFALVPGLAGGNLVCVLCADNGKEPYDFHESAMRFLRTVASQTALSLENALLLAELKRNNQELEEANRKLKELDKLKSQFLSVATHELRTPLTIMLGYNSMLSESLEGRLNDEERETIEESTAACKRLIRLVNSMLDITQIESGRMQMNFAPTDLRQVVKSVAALFQHEARKRDIRFHVELPARLPRLRLDPERIQQVLINLVGNALKFTASGGLVAVSVRRRNENGDVEVAVSDSGVGISPEDQPKIFDEFAQVRRQARQRQREGSGLGLAITRRIVEAHDGTIWVESQPGRGSTFRFSLPAGAAISQETSAVSA